MIEHVVPAGMRAALIVMLLAAPAFADDDFAGGTVIFARGTSLMKTDPRGKAETELATLPDKVAVRALRTDAGGTVLLANLGGTWRYQQGSRDDGGQTSR